MAPPSHPTKPPLHPTPTTLSTLTAFPQPLTAILLGVEGPREITLRSNNTRTLITNLLLCDPTHPGRTLTLWGNAALHHTHLRILDIIQLTKAVTHASGELRLRPGGRITRLHRANDTAPTRTPTTAGHSRARVRAREMLAFRASRFPELCAMAERGRLLARDWVCDSAYATQRRAPRGVGEVREFEGVRVSCIRIRLPRGAERGHVEAMKSLCRRFCTLCARRLPREHPPREHPPREHPPRVEEVRCACGGATQWGFGWLLMGARGIDFGHAGVGGRDGEVLVVVEGDALGRLLFGVDVHRIVEDVAVANACYAALEALVKDGGVFRAVIRAGAPRPRLLDLQV